MTHLPFMRRRSGGLVSVKDAMTCTAGSDSEVREETLGER